MCSVGLRTLIQKHIYLVVLTMFTFIIPEVWQASGAPAVGQKQSSSSKHEFESLVDTFLREYYDEVLAKQLEDSSHLPNLAGGSRGKDEVDKRLEEERSKQEDRSGTADIYDQMLGDQPASEASVIANNDMNEDINKTRERIRKESWVEYLKSHIISELGRNNTSMKFTKLPEDSPLNNFNISQIMPIVLNKTFLDDDLITEKIRSFYPACDTSQHQEQDQWKDSEDMMNLYFELDFSTDNRNSNIASATLRLYRLPQNASNKLDPLRDDCTNPDSAEEEKLLRVSVYWYSKLQKKRRVKRRLSDSKVLPESSRWVELSVKPATKSWTRTGSKNLGLGILVEDQEGKALRADKYFKGASCTVGVSTPKPIPTIIRDAAEADELDRIHSLLGRNSTSAIHSDLLLLPTVDICYLVFPEDTDISQFNSARINACNLRKIHEENQRLAEKERLERLATLPLPNRHIRHQRQHRQNQIGASELLNLKLENINTQARQISDLERAMRNSMMATKQIILTREELEALQNNKGLKR